MFPEGRILDFLIFGVVALVVVGPKDLPILMRKVGAAMARMRALAAEFRASFEDMARQSELDELRAEVEALRSGRALDPLAGGLGQETLATMREIGAGIDPATWTGSPEDPVQEPAASEPELPLAFPTDQSRSS